MPPTLQDLKTLAYGAGRILRAGFNQPQEVHHKSEIDVVTETDHRSESYLLEQIRGRFQDDHIVAEESGENDGDRARAWFIDPLDGTTNFSHGLPVFSVSIGYAQDGEILLGVVYDPVRDELFSAERGRGAFLNDQPIQAAARAQLRESLVATGFPYDRFTSPVNNLVYFHEFALQVQGIRRLGSAALDLCYVAAGRFDAYWEFKMHSWDLAAGVLIAQEAGALVTTMDGFPEVLTPPYSVAAANPRLHEELLAVIAGVTARPENQAYQAFLAG
jgi:myo-inositol-1(or 4)-monophosphatase